MVSTVAVGTDGTARAAEAVRFAIDLAKQYQARLVAISCYRPLHDQRFKKEREGAPADVQWSINPNQQVDEILAGVESHAQAAGLKVTTIASQGDPADVLVKHATEERADVLVVGNKGMQRRLLGSVPNSVTHKAPCTVVVVKTA
jgi:nucleotide-binding universal stress UspA family protein